MSWSVIHANTVCDNITSDVKRLLINAQYFPERGLTKTAIVSANNLSNFSVESALAIDRQLNKKESKVRPAKTIYASELGVKCQRKNWYNHNLVVSRELLPPSTLTKFMYGDIIENLALTLIEAAGHTVEHRQLPVSYNSNGWEVRGKIDAIIDEKLLVDVKSTTTFGMKDFKNGTGGNKFGYKEQLLFYKHCLPQVEAAAFVAVDKTLGHIEVVPENHDFTQEVIDDTVDDIVRHVMLPNPSLIAPLDLVEHSVGNMKLCTECSYCPYKYECWKNANDGEGLKSYLYSNKVIHLAEINGKKPTVPEIDPLARDSVLEDAAVE